MKGYIAGTALCLLSGGVAAEAVAEFNGKLDVAAGEFDGWDGKQASASAAGQLGRDFGWQADANWAHISDQDFYGLGGHLFWRAPQTGLLGVTASGVRRDGVDSHQFGIEGEYYLPHLTLMAGAGYSRIRYDQAASFIDTEPDGAYASAQLRYYLNDNLAVSVSGLHALDNSLGMAGIEYQTPAPGLSLFASAARGDHDYDHAMAGIRYYFGKTKSLKARHRNDDPDNVSTANLWTLGLYGAEYNKRLAEYAGSLGADFGPTYGVIITMPGYGLEGFGSTFTIPEPLDIGIEPLPPLEWQP